MVYRLRRGEKRPSGKKLEKILTLLGNFARRWLIECGCEAEAVDDQTAIVLFNKLIGNSFRYLM